VKAPKIMIVGFDAATRNLSESWVTEGSMPSLARLMGQGTHGQLDTCLEDNMAPGSGDYSREEAEQVAKSSGMHRVISVQPGHSLMVNSDEKPAMATSEILFPIICPDISERAAAKLCARKVLHFDSPSLQNL